LRKFLAPQIDSPHIGAPGPESQTNNFLLADFEAI
jgi:hypothetical protein